MTRADPFLQRSASLRRVLLGAPRIASVALASAFAVTCGDAPVAPRTSGSQANLPLAPAMQAPCPVTTPACRKGILASAASTCVWAASGVACWGSDVAGPFPLLQYEAPAITDVAIAGGHVCVRDAEGSIVCTGDSLPSPLSLTAPPPLEPGRLDLFGLHGQICVGRVGAAQCYDEATGWGEYRDSREPHAPSRIVRSGGCWTCSLEVEGERRGAVECRSEEVASDRSGRTCPGGATPPEPIEHAPPFVDIAVGDHHACGVTDDGDVWCWGDNEHAEVGQPASRWEAPVKVDLGGAKATGVAAGTNHSCALTSDGAVLCWGGSGDGELRGVSAVFQAYAGLSAGPGEMCAWNADSVLCGNYEGFRERSGLRGIVDVEPTFEDTAIFADPGGAADDVYSGGGLGWAALDGEGRIRVFRTNRPERLVHAPPHAVALVRNAPCALYADGGVWCWGRDYGSADAAKPRDAEPTAVSPRGLEPVRAVASTVESTTCGIASSDGALWCWGLVDGAFAAPSEGSSSRRLGSAFQVAPRKIAMDEGAIEIAASGRCVRHGDGTISLIGLHCNGGRCALETQHVDGLDGATRILQGQGCDVEMKDGTIESIATSAVLAKPTWHELSGLRGAVELAGGAQPCAVMSDGSVDCAYRVKSTPMFGQVRDLEGATHVAMEPAGGCATKKSGGLVCFAFAPEPVAVDRKLLGPRGPARVF